MRINVLEAQKHFTPFFFFLPLMQLMIRWCSSPTTGGTRDHKRALPRMNTGNPVN
jgi:hypothetical protein